MQEYEPASAPPSGYHYLQTYYDAFGQPAVVASSDGQTTVEDFFPPVAGRNYVKFDYYGTLFLHTDAIGSTGIATGQNNGAWQDTMYYPFGQVWHQVSCQCDIRFVGLRERDLATGFDPTPARNYASNLGRWTTPDPLGGDLTNPQSLNRYAYAALNRLTSKTYSDGTPAANFAYDQPSLTIGSWSSGTLYNTAGRLTETTTTVSGAIQTATVEDYDAMGRRRRHRLRWQLRENTRVP